MSKAELKIAFNILLYQEKKPTFAPLQLTERETSQAEWAAFWTLIISVQEAAYSAVIYFLRRKRDEGSMDKYR